MSDDMFYCSFVSIHYIICECGETFPTEEELKLHLEKDHSLKKERKEYKCGVCEAIFNTERACIEHYSKTHIEIKEEHDYVNTETTEDVEDAEEMEEPQQIVYEEIQTQEPRANEEPAERKVRVKKERKPKSYYNTKNIVCEVCGKRYASNAALKYHQRVHTGERPYHCTECDKSFTMPLFLQIHMRTHTGERPYECALCPKAFSNKAALLRHDRVHTGVKPYECPECGKFFTQSNSMKLHVNTVHLKMPAPYKSKTRKNKAKEREMLRNAILRVIDSEETTAVQTISQPETIETIESIEQIENIAHIENITEADTGIGVHFIKPEVTYLKQEVEETEIMYEDVDAREITYEVIYEE